MEMGFVQTTETLMKGRARGRPAGGGSAEYLLVLYPEGDLQDRLLEEQQQFSADYGLDRRPEQGQRIANDISGRNKPHITLASFQAAEATEDTLIRWMQLTGLVLLKRKHSFDPCKTVNIFGLKN